MGRVGSRVLEKTCTRRPVLITSSGPSACPTRITPPATSLWDNLEISARRYPDKAALIFFGRVFSYRELRDSAERLAARLHELGVRKGDRVLLDMQNCPQLVIAHFAILRANAVVVPVNPDEPRRGAQALHRGSRTPRWRSPPPTWPANSPRPATRCRAGQRLAHLIVSHFTDAFDPDAPGAEVLPEAWRDWLLTRHPLPRTGGRRAR